MIRKTPINHRKCDDVYNSLSEDERHAGEKEGDLLMEQSILYSV